MNFRIPKARAPTACTTRRQMIASDINVGEDTHGAVFNLSFHPYLAAVIAGGVIGFLFAIFLILLLVYRMRKKDEGSYDLGERKTSGAVYQKAPTKEFYA